MHRPKEALQSAGVAQLAQSFHRGPAHCLTFIVAGGNESPYRPAVFQRPQHLHPNEAPAPGGVLDYRAKGLDRPDVSQLAKRAGGFATHVLVIAQGGAERLHGPPIVQPAQAKGSRSADLPPLVTEGGK